MSNEYSNEPFKCCVTHWGEGIRIRADQQYEGASSNSISIMRGDGWTISRKKCYVIFQWP